MADAAQGYEEFFAEEYRSIVRVVFVIVGSWEVAQEVAQDAFVQAFVHWRKVAGYDKPGAWVRRVAIRRAVRARDRRLAAPVQSQRSPVSQPEGQDIGDLLGQLSTQQRAAVALHYLEDRSTAEVAQALGCSTSTVRTHLQRARAVLANQLAEIEE